MLPHLKPAMQNTFQQNMAQKDFAGRALRYCSLIISTPHSLFLNDYSKKKLLSA